MSTHTDTNGKPVPPVIPGGEELYNQIMSAIEMDLTTDNIPLLKEKYAGESEADQKVRMKKYADAFAEYEKQFALYQEKQAEEIRSFGHSALVFIENKDRQADNEALQSLESSMQNL